ncbi:MAG: hypothetical protein OET44_15340 [Gammaproteobacteria bacterium]|nr:hypothetical protein [Gammaproteobacteria bacterium]
MFAKNKRRQAAFWTLFLSLVLSSTGVVTPVWAGDDHRHGHKGVRVVAPDSQWRGHTYSELAGKWWDWAVAEPLDTNAVFDTDGSFCTLNQRGKVWFLAGTFGGIAERLCHIPAGKAIFFPILNGLSFPPEFPVPGDPCENLDVLVEQIRCDVNEDLAFLGSTPPDLLLEAMVDGERIADPFAYRAQTGPGGYKHIVPENEIFGTPAGPRFPAVADGYWILLKPLSPGWHEISFKATVALFDNFELGANYRIFVEPRRRHRHRH